MVRLGFEIVKSRTRRSGNRWRGVILAAIVFLAAGSLTANDRPVSEILGLTPDALARFVDLQDDWLEWLSAVAQGDGARVSELLDTLLKHAEVLGLQRLPDLSLGAAGRAIAFAEDERFDAAAQCLAAAEKLDSGRSEVAFAGARVAQLQGDYGVALRQSVDGYARLFQNRLLRRLWRADLLHWLLFVVLAGGAFYVAILMATTGIELFHDINTFIDRFVPDMVSLAVTVVLLVWPLLLPAGVFWLLVYWSVLLWSYGQVSQKVILVVLWVVLGTAPILINEQRQRIRVALAPTVLSIESLSNGQLQGSLFSDLAALRAALPDSIPVAHLVADLHIRLGEWDSARALYEALVEKEPENGSALLNLGVCHLQQGDQAQAMMHFQRAADSLDAAAAARFNMSQVLSELYRFSEAERELRLAQRLAPRQVGEWLRRVANSRAIVLDGGLQRTDEIRDQLVASWRSKEAEGRWSALWPRVLSLPLAIAFLVIAAGLHLIVRRGERAVFRPAEKLAPRGSWRSALLVGFAEVEDDRPLTGFFLILVLVTLFSLPRAAELGYRLPWIYGPGGGLASILAAAGLTMFVLVRLFRHFRGTL